VVLNGAVCSGKTSLAHKLVAEFADHFYRNPHASRNRTLHVYHVDFDKLAFESQKRNTNDSESNDANDIARQLHNAYPAQEIDVTSVALALRSVSAAIPDNKGLEAVSVDNSTTAHWDSIAWNSARIKAWDFVAAMCKSKSTSHIVDFGCGIHHAAFPKSGKAAEDFPLIIVDDNMLLRSMRKKYFQLARASEFGFVTISLQVSKSLSRKRNQGRSWNKIPDAVLEHSHNSNEVSGWHTCWDSPQLQSTQ